MLYRELVMLVNYMCRVLFEDGMREGQKEDLALSEADKIRKLIEEYLKTSAEEAKKAGEGNQSKGERSLSEIVEHLKTTVGELTTGKHKKRNTDDRVRRALDKLVVERKITKQGKTTKTRYRYNPKQLLSYYTVFTEVEELGGVTEKNKIPYFKRQEEYGFPEPEQYEIDRMNEKSETTPTHFEGRTKFNHINYDLAHNDDFEGPPWSVVGGIYSNDSKYWFGKQSNFNWMSTSYFGFQGPVGLKEIIDNIGENIEELPSKFDFVEKSLKHIEDTRQKLKRLEEFEEVFNDKQRFLTERDKLESNLGNVINQRTLDEIFLIKEDMKEIRKSRRYSHRNIITLALLHLNRSIVESKARLEGEIST